VEVPNLTNPFLFLKRDDEKDDKRVVLYSGGFCLESRGNRGVRENDRKQK
jgi:hypothetical protein